MMRASSKRSSSGPALQATSHFSRSISPPGRLGGGGGSAFAVTSRSLSSAFAPSSVPFLTRSASPTRVNFSSPSQPAQSVKFSLPYSHRPISPGRNIPAVKPARKTCMCSPTTHPGSFRCSLHKGGFHNQQRNGHNRSAPPSNRLNARRSAMTNSLVRISTVEGDLVKRALAALIRPSSHHQRRRSDFQPRPSRLSVMSKASDP
jgi:hypothetical protein